MFHNNSIVSCRSETRKRRYTFSQGAGDPNAGHRYNAACAMETPSRTAREADEKERKKRIGRFVRVLEWN